MLAVRIWNFIRGYVIIKVEGINLERFINLSIAKGIYFWDMERVNYTTIRTKVSLKGYKLLRGVKKKTACRVSILRKKGCPFLMRRVMKRKALAAGGATAVLIMYLLTSFIWVVQVQGNQKVSEDRIILELENLGLRPGVFKYSLDVASIETKLLIRMDQLAWVAINLLGTKAIVDVAERVEPPPLLDRSTPCNIVARRDGIIDDIFVFQGEPAVKQGDTVKAGQLLIDGVVDKPGMPARMVHAMGRVEARTWYQAEEVQQLTREIKERTGEVEEKMWLKVGGIRIKLTPEDIGFTHYEKTTDIKRLAEWRNIVLPVEIVIEKYYEESFMEENLTLDEGVGLAAQRAEQRLMEIIPEGAQLIDRKIKYYQEDGGRIRVEVILETLEDIGIEEKISIEHGED